MTTRGVTEEELSLLLAKPTDSTNVEDDHNSYIPRSKKKRKPYSILHKLTFFWQK